MLEPDSLVTGGISRGRTGCLDDETLPAGLLAIMIQLPRIYRNGIAADVAAAVDVATAIVSV